jgi:cation diffusion facilitator CzcD-associated flavoprotein CzcO
MLGAGLQPVIQEWLPGRRDAVSFFYTSERIWARFAQTSYRESPPIGGASVLCESIPPLADLIDPAERLIRAAGLEGCSMVEFRRDRAGRPVLMEINPRMAGSVALAISAGVDFPRLLYSWAVGKPLWEVTNYRVGRRRRWLSGDLWNLKQTFDGRRRPDTPTPGHAVATFLFDFVRRPSTLDVIDSSDMMPAVLLSAVGGECQKGAMGQHVVDVVIVGAGPYGLSLASHLSQRGIERRIFGFPMRAWRQMPPGLYLKSFGFATTIPTPQPHYTLPEYCRARGLEDLEPIEYATYAEYGEWFQQQLVPDLEPVHVTSVERLDRGFEVSLETGERVLTRHVVVAVGLGYFTTIPDVLSALPPELVTHTAHTAEYLKTSRYAGRDVTVIGAGQSALEAAVLLHEGGAHVRLLARRGVWFSGRFDRQRSLLEKLRNPNTVVGPGRDNWVLQHLPMLPHYLPTDRRVRLTRTYLGPMGTWWLRDRVEGRVPMLKDTSIVAATAKNGKVCLRVRAANGDEREIQTEHVIAGTGYEADVDRLLFLSRALKGEIRRVERAPALSRHFESSVPGLYFVGLAAAFSFGPLSRFVAGASYTTPTLARHLARSLKRQAPLRPAAPVAAVARPNPVEGEELVAKADAGR